MKLSTYVIDFIVREGVGHLFEFIGGAITHLLDSAHDRRDIRCISVHHEQAGAFAAEAYARINGHLGVAMATSGPGALNMVTGIGSCYFDSVPCLFITGQVNTYEYKFDRPVRQIGFQETDIVSVVRPLTKYAELVTDPASIRYHMEKAVYLARSGRAGPVLLDLPMNVQRAQIDPEKLPAFLGTSEHRAMEQQTRSDHGDLGKIVDAMVRAKRPMILAGGGIRSAGATDEFINLVDRSGFPVVTSLMGLDVIPHDHRAFCGMIGAYGNRYSNLSVANCDLLLILGSRLDSRQTGTRPDTFARGATKIHVDIDANELNAKVRADIAVRSNLKDFLAALAPVLPEQTASDLSSWYDTLRSLRERYPTSDLAPAGAGINPNRFMAALSGRCAEGDVICLDVGQNQMWAAQSFGLKKGQRMLISGGMGAMGFSLPAAMGAAFAAPGSRLIALSGDGGIQINIQDLDTIVRHRLPVKIFVMNNGCLGMVRQMQDLYFDRRRQSTVIGYGCPDLRAVAAAYGLPAHSVSSLEEAEAVFGDWLGAPGPLFVDVRLDQGTEVNPKLVVNRPIEDMSPHLDRNELKDIMLIDLAKDQDIPK
jgi:acetolactate synthase I/II/III large subunit